ncbi:hypothetical protein ABIE44_001232 [Marmoricola sp. OAE513]|uniref:DUF4190 domain-containing protein n=1 Tax=Marmoricola sp. OAE513 TaxID=2817894 RepID=UPI001AE5826A
MSDPNPPAGEPSDEVGYWEKLAASGPQEPPSQIQFNPQSGTVLGSAEPQAAPGSVPAPPPNAAWAPPPQQQTPYGYGVGAPGLPDHPKADLAFVFGMIAGPGAIVSCLLTILVAPVALVLGYQARKAIDAEPGRWGGRGKATTGFVIGMIGTAVLALGLVTFTVLVIVAASDPDALSLV